MFRISCSSNRAKSAILPMIETKTERYMHKTLISIIYAHSVLSVQTLQTSQTYESLLNGYYIRELLNECVRLELYVRIFVEWYPEVLVKILPSFSLIATTIALKSSVCLMCGRSGEVFPSWVTSKTLKWLVVYSSVEFHIIG